MKKIIFILVCCMLFACTSKEGHVKDALIEQSTIVEEVPSVSSRVRNFCF